MGSSVPYNDFSLKEKRDKRDLKKSASQSVTSLSAFPMNQKSVLKH